MTGQTRPWTDQRFADDVLARMAADYARDGAVHVPGLLEPSWIDRLSACIEAVRTAQAAGAAPEGVECYTAPGRLTIRWMHRAFADAQAFFTESGAGPVTARIIGAATLQYWFDLTFVHEPAGGAVGTPWHHDIAAFPFSGTQIPSLWIAMSDIPLDMAPLQCIQGSHLDRTQYRPPVYIDEDAQTPAGYADLPDVSAAVAEGRAHVLQWDVKAGDAIIIHPYTLHGAPPVAVERSRIAFTTRWMGDDVRWAPDAFSMAIPGVDYGAVRVGERPDGPLFPYLDGWS